MRAHASIRLLLTSSLLLLLCTAAFAPQAHAQDKEAAAKYFQEGQQAYAGGDYGAAIFNFSQAYNEDPNGIFLYMTSLAYMKSNNFEKAIEFGKKTQAQASDLDPDKQARNEARLLAMQHALATKQQTQLTGVTVSQLIKDRAIQAPPAGARTGIGGVGWTGVGMMVAGSGLMLSSLYFNSKVSDLLVTGTDGEPRVPSDKRDEVARYQLFGLTALGTGVVLTLVGGGLFVYALGSRDKTATLQLMPTRGGAYTGLQLRF